MNKDLDERKMAEFIEEIQVSNIMLVTKYFAFAQPALVKAIVIGARKVLLAPANAGSLGDTVIA